MPPNDKGERFERPPDTLPERFDAPPFVKKWTPQAKQEFELFLLVAVEAPKELENEATIAKEVFGDVAGKEEQRAFKVRLALSKVEIPEIQSRYRDRIAEQAYRITIGHRQAVIESPTPEGVAYGIQTLGQMAFLDSAIALWDSNDPHPPRSRVRAGTIFGHLPKGEVVDWPDLPVRMIMLDPARQNENFEYYKRVIRFCARYKINAILLHLTDDDTAALYHPDYPELMHPHAWKPEDARELAAMAAYYHIELIPEIESLGHSRMFVRRPDFREILHQTRGERTETWMGTDVPGYTNVLCPASEKTYEYLDKMYARAAKCFPGDTIHIGCDEVDMISCERCEKKFPGITKSAWFRNHILRCREIAARHGRKIALWGDMLLKYPDIMEGLPTTGTLIYDWHYNPDVTPDSVSLFQKHGFEVVACPALMCAPHMLYPDAHNYVSIRRFTEIARHTDALGVDTTIWIPQRYTSDVLWPGIAYAAGHAWGGSSGFTDEELFAFFFRDQFSRYRNPLEEAAFARAWMAFTSLTWHRSEFYTACWADEKSFEEARKLAADKREKIRADQEALKGILVDLAVAGEEAKQDRATWNTMQQSAAALGYLLQLLQAAATIQTEKGWDYGALRALDAKCVGVIGWIEKDWDRNRYADDPNKNGIHKPGEHLLWRFRQMHAYHQKILEEGNP